MVKVPSSLLMSALILALILSLGCGCGGSRPDEGGSPPATLTCPTLRLPDVSSSYTETVEGLVVVPSRARLRSATDEEMSLFRDFVVEEQRACAASPLGRACELGALRLRLTALTTPAHSGLFADIDSSFDAALASAHADYAAADRDCDGQAEAVCDARAITSALVRATCELSDNDEGEGH